MHPFFTVLAQLEGNEALRLVSKVERLPSRGTADQKSFGIVQALSYNYAFSA